MFSGKVVLITGASSGIGAATALKFAKAGAKLSLTGRNKENLQNIAFECEKVSNEKPFLTLGDVSVEADIKLILTSTIDHFGRLDVLINNAGVLGMASIENTTLEQFDLIFNTNVRAVYYLTMLAVPYLIESKGCIVNTSSLMGIRAFPGLLAYSMSKSAINQFTACAAQDLAPHQVRVNSVNPGLIMTQLQRRGAMDEDTYRKYVENCRQTHPLGRPGQPEEVADAILFLASGNASFITGVNLSVDGGRLSMCLK